MQPYQRALLERGIAANTGPFSSNEDPTLNQGMMYAGSVGTMIMDDVATAFESVEENERLMRRQWERDETTRENVEERLSETEEAYGRLRQRTQALEDLVDYLGPQVEHLTTALNAQIAWSQGLRETVDVMRDMLLAREHGPENPIVVEDDDEDEVEVRVEEEELEVPGAEADDEPDLEDEGRLIPIEEEVDEDLEIRIARTDPAPEYEAPPDY